MRGKPIPSRRLEVLPHPAVDRISEAIGGDYKTLVIPKNTGKPGSLKKNYDSWKVKLCVITTLDKE